MRMLVSSFAFAGALATSSLAWAQQPLPPLPADNNPGSSDGDAQPAPSSPSSSPPAVEYEEAQPVPPRPAVYEHEEAPPPKHAPKFALYAGGSIRLLGFGGYFYDNEQRHGETTGNFVKTGLGLELDVGVRLGYRYTPFLFLEHGFMGKGHRFDGTSATASSDLGGIGFRYTAGNPNTAGFLTEISVGVRVITIKNGSETYRMSTAEVFRLGLGAEIRLSTLFTISPMAHLSGGAMNDTEGDVTFGADGSKDGITHPTYKNGATIDTQRTYMVVGLGCGGHFDFFGK